MKQLSIGELLSETMSIHDTGFAIPALFIFLKLIHVSLPISLETADSLVQVLSSFWPSMGPQYQEFIRLKLPADAVNYALFYLCLFVLFVYVLQKIVRVSIANRNRIEEPGLLIVLLIILVAASTFYFAMLRDLVPSEPRLGFFAFAIDSYGLYYIRQWALFSCSGVVAALLVPSAVSLVHRIYGGTHHLK